MADFPRAAAGLGIGLGVIGASLLATTSLVVMQTWVVRRIDSTAIAVDRAHYLTDVAVNAAVLAALGLTKLIGWMRAVPAFALAISGYMLWSARTIARVAFAHLLDRELPGEDRQRIKDVVLACAGARDVHGLRTRFSSDRTWRSMAA